VLNDKLLEAMDYGRESGMDQFDLDIGSWWTCYPGRPDYFTHWGAAFQIRRVGAGLADRWPIRIRGRHKPSLPQQAKTQIENAYRRARASSRRNSPRKALQHKGLGPPR